MATLSNTFESAQRHHQAGELNQAEQLYRQVLIVDGQNAEIWYLLAETCQRQGKLADSLASYQQALRRKPDHVDARTNLGVVLASQRRIDEAIVNFREALRLKPDYAKVHHNLGVALAEQGKHEEAVQSLQQAIRLKPDYAEAHYNLGNVLVSLNQRHEAVTVFKQALAIKPDYGEVYNNLGLALIDLGQVNEAAIILQQAVRLRPVAESFNNLGLALADQGKFADAEANYHQALRLNPSYADAHSNLGNLYKEQGRLEEVIASYQQALWLQPDSASTHWNRSLAWLQMGDFEKGWAEYEWRWKRKQTPPRPFRQPVWDGSPLAGRTILLHMEQGLGDMIQFIRYAPLVKDRGGTVLVECPAPLISLFSSCAGIDQLIPEGSPLPDFQVHAPLMSLPRLFGTTLATIPAEIPHLKADERLVECWRQKLGTIGDFKIGICWQGNPHHKWDRHRSIPLIQFAPLACLPGVRLVSLQKAHGTEQLKDFAARFQVTDLGPDLDTSSGAFVDTAAAMKNLDLVVTTDTAIAHLFALQQPAAEVPGLLNMRLRYLLKEQKQPAAVETAAKMKELAGDKAEQLYNAACVYALCAAAARPVKSLVDGAPGCEKLAEEALALLKQAIAKGYKDAAHMKQDKDLEALREREDFKKLVAELEAAKKP